ncbi:hypothetical protein, partial [Escherichia coli]|uniref:hypothetical protein n=1 Tax=Escherichia coli TaxID=562 RepID=UPI001914E304
PVAAIVDSAASRLTTRDYLMLFTVGVVLLAFVVFAAVVGAVRPLWLLLTTLVVSTLFLPEVSNWAIAVAMLALYAASGLVLSLVQLQRDRNSETH